MKTLKISLLFSLFIFIAQLSFAQTSKKESFKVAGECGMCKKKIETAAKNAGASYAVWNADTKIMTVKYSSSTSSAKIHQAIANAGYDTQNIKATEEDYNKLHECCKYERNAADCCTTNGDKDCCADTKAECCKKV